MKYTYKDIDIKGVLRFLFKVLESSQEQHIISARDIQTAEKNIVEELIEAAKACGITANYYNKENSKLKRPYVELKTKDSEKNIYIVSWSNENSWQDVLNGRYGCVFISEPDIANMEYVTQVLLHADSFVAQIFPSIKEFELKQIQYMLNEGGK